MELGVHLSAEEHDPATLVEVARTAEDVGFGFATISDHYHPWTTRQGQSPFVWTVLGMAAASTERIRFMTAVTCPTIRMHPAVVAQAAATTAAAMPDRFDLGVGSGENLNEHVIGDRWPSPGTRLELLEEAIHVIRELFSGERISHRGEHYEVEGARLFTLPERPPQVHVAAGGTTAADVASRLGDGLVLDSPDGEVVEDFRKGPDDRRPVTGKLMTTWAPDREDAVRTALDWWPIGGVGPVGADLRLPEDFEAIAGNCTRDAALKGNVVTDDVAEIAERVRAYEQVGATRVALHQVGHDQQGFLDGPGRELLAEFG